MNAEPKHLNYWFCANKLSLNTDKTKSVLFHKAKRLEVKNLGVMIDENLTWKTHVELVENEISNSVGILSKASRSLNSKSLRSIFFALVHPYINYANFTWASTHKTYLKRILGKQKHVTRLMSSVDISIPWRLLMKELNILNVYQTNTLQHLYIQIQKHHNS